MQMHGCIDMCIPATASRSLCSSLWASHALRHPSARASARGCPQIPTHQLLSSLSSAHMLFACFMCTIYHMPPRNPVHLADLCSFWRSWFSLGAIRSSRKDILSKQNSIFRPALPFHRTCLVFSHSILRFMLMVPIFFSKQKTKVLRRRHTLVVWLSHLHVHIVCVCICQQSICPLN
jgi:hypothetical protein